MPITSRPIGFTARSPPALFPAPAAIIMIDRPLMLDAPVSAFRVVRPPQSSFAVFPALDPQTRIRRPEFTSRKHYLPGFQPSLRHHRARPLTARLPIPRYVPPTGFLSLSAGSSAPRLFGLVSSRSHIQGSPVQGFFPSHSRRFLVGRPFPHAVGSQLLTARKRLPVLRASTSRL
jgi:hypothetical protein